MRLGWSGCVGGVSRGKGDPLSMEIMEENLLAKKEKGKISSIKDYAPNRFDGLKDAPFPDQEVKGFAYFVQRISAGRLRPRLGERCVCRKPAGNGAALGDFEAPGYEERVVVCPGEEDGLLSEMLGERMGGRRRL